MLNIGNFLSEKINASPRLEKEDSLKSIENKLLNMAEDLKIANLENKTDATDSLY